MFINDVADKDDCRNNVLHELKTLGVLARPKRPKPPTKAKGKVFKVSLESLPSEQVALKTGKYVKIPKVLDHLCSLILANVATEGIFRKESPKARLAEIRGTLEMGNNLDDSFSVIDVAVILKIFFRELPEPLIPWGHHELFLQSILLESNEDKLHALLLACLLLPDAHLNTLIYLLQFLLEVARHSSENKMDAHNLAVCFAPSLFPIEEKSASEAQTKTLHVNEIFTKLIENSFDVGLVPDYSTSKKVEKTKSKKRRSTSLSRMFNGLKKIVGGKSGEGNNNHNVVTPDLLLTPVSNATKRRKTHANGISNRKKKELLNKLPDNVLLSTPFTPCRTPVSMDLSGIREKHSTDSTDLIKEKKSQWFLRSKSVKNLKNEEVSCKNRGNTQKGLERRWSALSQPMNGRRAKKRNSFATRTLSHNEIRSNTNKEGATEPDYIRVPKEEYEAIKNRVSAMERRISMELDSVQSLINTDNQPDTKEEVASNIKNVQTVYEQTLVQTEQLSPTTDQLAKRLSRELKIRRSVDQKIIRSPSARKIGSMRRRSKEFDKNSSRVSRHQSWHAPQTNVIPRVNLKRGKPNTVFTGLPTNRFNKEAMESKEMHRVRSSSAGEDAIKTISISCNLSGSSCDTWVSAEGFFATLKSSSESSSLSGRASLAKLRSQNAGMVLAKAKLFDKLKESDGSSSSGSVRSTPRAKVGIKIGSSRNPDSRLSYRVKNLKYEEKRIGRKSMSPRRRNGCLSQKQKLQMARHYLDSSNENNEKENISENNKLLDRNMVVPLKDCNRIDGLSSPKYSTPKAVPPHIKRSLNVRSPKRLCRTPVGLERSTPLRVLKTPVRNQL